MRTVETYWMDCEKYGFVKYEEEGQIKYLLPPELGEGGFTILGDTKGAMAILSDCTLRKPWIIVESVHEKMIELSQYYTGSAFAYKKKTEIMEFEYGLNTYVNYPYFYGYKRVNPGIKLINIGFCYRENFFKNLPYSLPEDFWEMSSRTLNSYPVKIPQITYICNQIKECSLTGTKLKIYIQGKALEVFAFLLDYIYSHPVKDTIYLSEQDKKILNDVKEFLEKTYADSITIKELTKKFPINQQKLIMGFKESYNMTINKYTTKLRMTGALELLYDTELPIAEIAKSVGYYGDGFFQKAFKNTYGVTPGQMRKEIMGH